ncbi:MULTISPECIES: ABC transporter permease [unclassified Bacillus (in: firmicutes)]|uniref:ABC transporter permease n=1 Tax=unclassified Bacillus (in: firmicutes) TaxID=185979 RepID=UPI000BEF3644|nr:MULTISPECIES: ABC transporter permease [unclassified Bacillus (in: firmicutes)]PEJ59463.1 teichoic acid ABC transporter permease [Bacillus sp. AFS002410]PEL13528.1 teichoic acid ABC transporter permease [Bacillus sp. AFS017336]
MKNLTTIFKEHFSNFYMIGRLSNYEMKKEFADSQLGTVWAFINPLLQIGVYWLIFGTGIRKGLPVDGIPFIFWMLCGLIPWFFISSSILQGSSAIFNRLNTVSKMNFPLSIIPTYVILSRFYTHLFMLALLLISVVFSQGFGHINVLSLLYFMFVNLLFATCLALVSSTLSTLIRDIHLLIQSTTRMLLYLTPILWVPRSGGTLQKIMMLNPYYYIVTGYRRSILYNDYHMIFSLYSVYFWCFMLALLIFGAVIHIKFRKSFVDIL